MVCIIKSRGPPPSTATFFLLTIQSQFVPKCEHTFLAADDLLSLGHMPLPASLDTGCEHNFPSKDMSLLRSFSVT